MAVVALTDRPVENGARAERRDEQGQVARRLLAPQREVGLNELAGSWFRAVVSLRMAGAADLALRPELPGKIRGALGRCLAESGSPEAVAGRPCPWRPVCALDVLFRTQGRITPRLELPKPYAIAVAAEDEDLVVRLTLFGFASDWAEMAADALVRAVRERLSVGRRLEVGDRRLWSEEAVEVPEVPPAVLVSFVTPVAIRTRDGAPADLGTFVATLGNRVSGLARWQDAWVSADWRALKAHAGSLSVRADLGHSVRWQRHSRRQERVIPMRGTRPRFVIEGDLAPILPLLAVGQTTHVGSHASVGMGRYMAVALR